MGIFKIIHQKIIEYRWKKFVEENKDAASKYICGSYTEPSLKKKYKRTGISAIMFPSMEDVLQNRDLILGNYELEKTYQKVCDLVENYPYGTAVICRDKFRLCFIDVDRMPGQVISKYAESKGDKPIVVFGEGLPIVGIDDFDAKFCEQLLGYRSSIEIENRRIESLLQAEDIKNEFEDSVLANEDRKQVYALFLQQNRRGVNDKEFCVKHISELDAYVEHLKQEQRLKKLEEEKAAAKKRIEQERLTEELGKLIVLVEKSDVDIVETTIKSIDKIVQSASPEQKESFERIKIAYSNKMEAGIPQEEKLCYVNYDIPIIRTKKDSYAIVRMPRKGCIVWPYRRKTIARRGYLESSFENRLKEFIGQQARVLGDVNILPQNDVRPFEPDIAVIYAKNGLNVRIDIEIDEPYAAITNKPTHYIGCGDEYRDANLNCLGWIVIRFSEKQVFQQTKSCVKFLFNIIKSIDNSIIIPAEVADAPILNPEKQWTMIESQKMANDKERQKYLHHEFGITEESHYGVKDLKLTPFEVSILDEVEHVAFVPTNQHDIKISDDNYYSENSISYNGKNAFEQDQHVIFERLSHVYSIDGIQYKAVSNLISELFPVFDSYYWAEIKANQRGVDIQQVIEEWDAKGQEAREAGVFLHQQIENLFLEQPLCHLYHFQYDGVFVNIDKTIDIQKEYGFFKQFIKDHPVTPFRTEWKIFDRSTKIAGTIDLICKNGDGYDIYDWKRSSKIHRPNPYQCGLGALSHLEDTSLNHYKLQQNLYRYMLENQYGMNIKSMKLVILHPDFNSYEIIDVERMDNEINTIIRML